MSTQTSSRTSSESSSSKIADLADADDRELSELVRAGNSDAFAELFRRHQRAASRFASLYANDAHTAQDLVAEAFVRVLHVLKAGGGPATSFRGYLMTVLRNIVTEWSRVADRQVLVPDVVSYERETAASAASEALRNLDRSLALQALASLPERWQDVLLYTVVHAQEPSAIAGLLGISPNSAAALAYRAREGLRQAYLTAHLNPANWPAGCEYYIARLAAHSRGKLGKSVKEVLCKHLAYCENCRGLYGETEAVNAVLRGFER